MTGYTAIFEQARDGYWSGYVPDLPTILTGDDTLDEARAHMKEAIELWIEEMKEQGLPIPQPSAQATIVLVAA